MTRLTALLLLLIAVPLAAARPTIDAHLHHVNFLHDSDGLETLLDAMDAADIDAAVVLGLPVTKKWEEDAPREPRYYMGDEAPVYYYSAADPLLIAALDALPAAQQRRLYPFLSGFNPTDLNAVEHVRRMIEAYPGRWQGIGEILTRHDDLTALTDGETARANHPALIAVYRLAAQHDLPVLLHSNLTSKRERSFIYLPELEEALAAAPDTRFIWAHAGTSAEIHRHQGALPKLGETVEQLLKRYPNLYVDLSWTVLEPYLLDQEGRPDPDWVALVSRWPQRFVIGSDVVGRFGNLGKIMHSFEPFLAALPSAVADRVARKNVQALLPGQAAMPLDD